MFPNLRNFLLALLSPLGLTPAPTTPAPVPAPAPSTPGTPAPPATSSTAAHPTYLIALGLIGLGVYQYLSGDAPAAIQSVLGGLAAAGVLHGTTQAATAAVTAASSTAAQPAPVVVVAPSPAPVPAAPAQPKA